MGTLCQKCKKIGDHHACFGDKLCGTSTVDHAKLPNLVIVAILGFIYFWRKMKAFRPPEGRRCDEIKFEWIHLVNYHS